MGKLVRGVTDLATVRPDLAAEWHPSKNADLTARDVATGSDKKAWWVCSEGHEWEAAVGSRNRGSGCPVCSGQKVLAGFNDLATLNPGLAAEWNSKRNGTLSSHDVTSGSGRRVWWLCEQGHEWENSIDRRNAGRGCPVCAGQQVHAGLNDLATMNPDLASQWHPSNNGDLAPSDVRSSSHKKVWWLCEQGHEWAATIASRNGPNGCPICAGRQVLAGFNDLATLNPALAAEWHPTKNDPLGPRLVTQFSNTRISWRCTHGHEWESTVGNRHDGRACPYCSGRFAIAGETDLATLNPALAAEWHPTKNGTLTPRDVTARSNKKAWWVCARGHEWQAVVNSRNSGIGCPVCAGQQVLTGFNDLETTNTCLAAEWHPTKNGTLTPRDVVAGTHRRVWWLCEQGHEWAATINSRNGGNGCPGCANYGYDPTAPGYMYVLRKDRYGLQQFGITNKPDDRLATHRRSGWELLDIIGPADGVWIVETETALVHFFKAKGLLLPRDYPDKFDGYSESWHSDQLSFSTCAEMLEALRDWEKKV